jgi:CheY-like chemotaxis protein
LVVRYERCEQRRGWTSWWLHDGRAEASGEMNASRPRLLLADDEKDIRDVLVFEFSDAGFEVTAVDSGLAALEALKKSKFDLVITDYKMPGMDGLETARRLRALDPKVPIIVATGYAGESTQTEFEKSGVHDFLLKPFALDDVIALAQRALAAVRASKTDPPA